MSADVATPMAMDTPTGTETSLPAKSKKSEKKANSRSKRAGLKFPVKRIDRYMRVVLPGKRFTEDAGVSMAAMMEYMIAEVLELAGNVAADQKRTRITPRAIKLGIQGDTELKKLLDDVYIPGAGVEPGFSPALLPKKKGKAAQQEE